MLKFYHTYITYTEITRCSVICFPTFMTRNVIQAVHESSFYFAGLSIRTANGDVLIKMHYKILARRYKGSEVYVWLIYHFSRLTYTAGYRPLLYRITRRTVLSHLYPQTSLPLKCRCPSSGCPMPTTTSSNWTSVVIPQTVGSYL